MEKKKLLVINDNPSCDLYEYLRDFPEYIVTKVSSYNELTQLNFDFDICTIDISEDAERDFTVFYILQMNQSQKVLQLYRKSIHCFFDCKCKMEEKHNLNIKSIEYKSTEKIKYFLDNFDNMKCQFKKITSFL